MKHKNYFTLHLMQWHRDINTRQMPWKGEKDPYKIWLSEIILQQTRVEQGLAYYIKFIRKFPTIRLLAAAGEEELYKLWEGLGYYSRCKNMQQTARYIASELAGGFPKTYQDILQLKGIGPYTAAAIASFAYNLPHAVVDGNVSRVLARFFGIQTPIDSTAGKQQIALLAQELLNKNEPGIYNQAIMDFGATVCLPRQPLCTACPMQSKCSALLTGQVNGLPVKQKKMMRTNRWFYYYVLQTNDSIVVRKRMAKDIWQNLYEFVLVESPHPLAEAELKKNATALSICEKGRKDFRLSACYKQQLTHQTIHLYFIHTRCNGQSLPPGYEKVSMSRLKKKPFPKTLKAYLEDTIFK